MGPLWHIIPPAFQQFQAWCHLPLLLVWHPGEEEEEPDPEDHLYLIRHLSHLRFLYSLNEKVRVGRHNGLYLSTRGSETPLQAHRGQGDLEVQVVQVRLPIYLHPNLGATLFLYRR